MKNQLLYFLTSLTLCLPNVQFAQPNLGTAANFVLFTKTGAVSNAGISHLTGNVGTNSGTITDFGNVDGQMHNGDMATGLAAADLQNAYDEINLTAQTASHGVLLGTGETLNAGVYQIDGATFLNFTLNLDGQGDPNAVFIFKIDGGTLTSAADAQVVLLNNAKACNVFWRVKGAVSIGANTSMKGTIIADNAAINLSTNVTLEGRALSTTGALMVTNVSAFTPLGCGTPILRGPTAPTLGSIACYDIFSSDGSVTNSGSTFVSGDVGANTNATTGFNPLTVTGTIHETPDGSTAIAASDLANINTSLNALVPDIELLYPAMFGSGLVLTAHTYYMGGAVSLNGTVFLNADGNTNAVFVIQVNGAFTTSAAATVTLQNGAQAKNVFWKINGAVTIDINSDFKGNIVASNGAITMNSGTILNGRALATNGNISVTSINAAKPSGGCVLPVSWLYFKGTTVQDKVLLEWATSEELRNDVFTVEKSHDGQLFETLATVKAAAVKNPQNTYAFTDEFPYRLGYYRISQMDFNGEKSYTRTIEMNTAKGFKAMQYVQANAIYLQTSDATPGDATLSIFSIDGRVVSSQKIVLNSEVSTYKIEKPAQNGLYLLYLESKGEKPYVAKVMVVE